MPEPTPAPSTHPDPNAPGSSRLLTPFSPLTLIRNARVASARSPRRLVELVGRHGHAAPWFPGITGDQLVAGGQGIEDGGELPVGLPELGQGVRALDDAHACS